MSHYLTTRIHNVRFTPVRLREGYDMREVDTFLDELEQAVQQQAPLRPLVERARFSPVRLREGYSMRDVDDFLEELVRDSEGASAAGAAPGAAPADPAPAATAATTPTAPTAPQAAPAPTVEGGPSVIQEQRGIFSRLFGGK